MSSQISYKSKMDSSEHKAHYQNIATKILKEMSALRSLVEGSPIAPRRWIWELIQNAKDVHNNTGVKIIINYEAKDNISFVTFKHNGKPFTADNIRFLIEQISTKDRSKDTEGKRKTTGKFGTGFLTTHLLSEKVTVKGVAKEPELDFRKFTLELDRSGFEIEDITNAVQTAKLSVANLDDTPIFKEYEEDAFNTEFIYPIVDSVGEMVAKAGFNDINICLPYTLTFVEEISTIEIVPKGQTFKKSNFEQNTNEEVGIHSIEIVDKIKNEKTIVLLATLSKGFTTIAIPIFRDGKNISLKMINPETPRMFCDFPLIGTEVFPFPVIINNSNFNPTDPRDGVFLTSPHRSNPLIEENKVIIKDAVNLYFQLLNFAVDNKWSNLHILAHIKPLNEVPIWIDEQWYNKEVLNPIREKLLQVKIVTNAHKILESILNNEGKPYILFPTANSKEIRLKIWELCSAWFPLQLPHESEIEIWNKLAWDKFCKLTLTQVAAFIHSKKSISELAQSINVEQFSWLNNFYFLLNEDDKEYHPLIKFYAIFPDQNGEFKKLNELSIDSGDIEDEFKDILELLGEKIRSQLLDQRIFFPALEDTINREKIIKEINTLILEKTADREVAKKYKEAFKKLLLWFQTRPEQAKLHFSNIYRNKHLLYDDEEILENIAKAEEISNLMKDNNVESFSELKKLIERARLQKGSNLLPITEEILLSMGISSPEEWAKAIEDKNLAAIYSHESVPSTDMFIYVQSLIKQAKENIIPHLRTLDSYDLTELDVSTAPTILAGIKKDGREISIVARPAYSGEVIIYYGSERDILDFVPSELWVDDGILPRKISLGHILKTASIVKFPI